MDTQINNQELQDWLDSTFLKVADTQDNEIVEVLNLIGFVESFGKKKFQIELLVNGKHKFYNLNQIQYRDILPIHAGDRYQVKKIVKNNLTTLQFKRL